MPKNASTNVVDFMSLLQKSIKDNKRTPAKKSGSTTKKAGQRSTGRRKSSTRKKAAKRS
jgi:DNA end-binding protein Ku